MTTVKHVDRDGGVLNTFVDGRAVANVDSITEELNAPGGFVFTLPLDADGAADLEEGSEIQVWEVGESEPEAWGYVEGIQEDTTTALSTFTCRGLLGLLGERYVGDTEREDRLLGTGSFDGPGLPAGWTAVGCTPTIQTSSKMLGAGALNLNKTAADGEDAYYEYVLHDVDGGPIGTAFVLAGYRRLNSYEEVLGRRGIYLEGVQAGVSRDHRTDQIDEDDVGPWEATETLLWVPNNETWDVVGRLYAPGDIDWDEVVLVAYDSISTGPGGLDQRLIAEALVSHAQSSLYGKTDENIGFPPGGNLDTGVVRVRHYQHVAAANILAALQEFATTVMDGGFDFWVEVGGGGTTRTFRIGFPRRGTSHPGLTMSTAAGGRLASARRSSALGKNSVRIQGAGEGPDRREAGAKDLTALGGKAFELVDQAPTETPIDGLAGKAAGVLASRKRPRTYELMVKPDAGVYGVIRPGDSFPAELAKGRLTYSGDLRAMKVTRYPRTKATSIVAVED